MTQFQLRFALACALSGAMICSAALAKRPKAAVDAAGEDTTICIASDADSQEADADACAVNHPPDRAGDDAPAIAMGGVSDDDENIEKPRSTKELQQALRDLDKLADDASVPCDGGDLSIFGEVDNHQNLVVNAMDIASIRAEPSQDDNGGKQGRVIIQLCPTIAKKVREARSVEKFRFSGESIPLVDGKIAVDAAGEISIDRATFEHAKAEAELLRRTCLVQCAWSQ